MLRFASHFAALAALALAPPASAADAYPCPLVRIVAPNPPGGATDVLSRMIAPGLQQRLGVPINVENKGGASTNIGTEFVVRAPPDGCTMLLGNISMALNKGLFNGMKFDVESDLRAVAQVAAVPMVLYVHPQVPSKTMAEFVQYAKAQNGKVSFSSAGIGTPTHLVAEMLNQQHGTNMIHVPYKGAGPATADVLAGQVQSSADSLIPMVPHIKNGFVKPLGVTGSARSAALPSVPTFTEQGFSQADITLWYGVMVPAKTPRDIVARLNAEINAVLSMPDVQKRLVELGSEDARGTPEAFQAVLRDQVVKLGGLIRKAGITAE